jgi:hypothetical protein
MVPGREIQDLPSMSGIVDDERFVHELLQLMIEIAPDRVEIERIIRERGVTLTVIHEESITPFAVDITTSEIKVYEPVLARHMIIK